MMMMMIIIIIDTTRVFVFVCPFLTSCLSRDISSRFMADAFSGKFCLDVLFELTLIKGRENK